MGRFRNLDDDAIERLIKGHAPHDQDDLEPLASLLREVKETVPERPAPSTADRHIAAIVEAAGEFDTHRALAPERPRRKTVLSAIFAGLTTKIAVATVAAAAATGGLAATGNLPDPAQQVAADVADRVGFSIPDPAQEAAEAEAEEAEEAEVAEETEGDKGKSVSEDVHTVLEDDTLEGRAKGDAVSGAASQNRQDGEHRPAGTPSGPPEGAGQPEGTPTGESDAPEGEEDPEAGNPTGYGADSNPGGRP